MDKFVFLEKSPYFFSLQKDEKYVFYIFEDDQGKGWINVPQNEYNEVYWEYTNYQRPAMFQSPWITNEGIPAWFVDLLTVTLQNIEKRDRLRRVFSSLKE